MFCIEIDCFGTYNLEQTGKIRNLKLQYLGGLCLLRQVKYAFRAKRKCLKVILTWQMANLSGVVLLYEILEDLLESKPFKTSRNFHIFLAKLALCMFKYVLT